METRHAQSTENPGESSQLQRRTIWSGRQASHNASSHPPSTQGSGYKCYREKEKAPCCSPVIFRLKVTNRNEAGSTSHSKFVLEGGPLDKGGCAVNPQYHQGGFPNTIFLTPHVGITVCPASDDAVTLGGPINACKRDEGQ
jgi:hypothetical protein